MSLDTIPVFSEIVDRQGRITLYFRLLWDKLRTLIGQIPVVASYAPGSQSAAIGTTTIYTVVAGGLYRISLYARVTIADGVASAVQATIGWADTVALTHVGANVNGDTTSSLDKFSIEVYCDANSTITLSTTYASTTPAKMHYTPRVTVEQLGSV